MTITLQLYSLQTSGMLKRLYEVVPFSRSDHSKPAQQAEAPQEPRCSPSALKIVHAGGKVELFYMAIPAVRILEKYPSYVLAKPEVFRRPWDSVVRPEKILTPGHKFLLVPHGTVKKLRRRIKKPSLDISASFISQASAARDVSSEASGSFINGFRKRIGMKKHVTFVSIDAKYKASGSSTSDKKGKNNGGNKTSSNFLSHGQKRRPRNALVWQPALNSIDESQGN